MKANPKKSPVSVPKRNSSSNQLSGSQAVPSLASLPSLTPSSVPESPRGESFCHRFNFLIFLVRSKFVFIFLTKLYSLNTGTLRRPKSFRSGKKFQFSARGESDGAVNRLGLSFGLASHMQEEGATEIGSLLFPSIFFFSFLRSYILFLLCFFFFSPLSSLSPLRSMIGEADQCVNFFEDYMGFSKLISEKFSVCLAAEQVIFLLKHFFFFFVLFEFNDFYILFLIRL